MSLYEVMQGENPMATDLLTMISMSRDHFGRYRDAHLSADGTEIRITARIGKGAWFDNTQAVMARIQTHPYFLRDQDDDFDPTFKYIWFGVSGHWLDIAKERATGVEPPTIKEQMDATLAEFDAMTPEQRDADPRVQKMKEAFEKIEKGGGGIVEI